MFEYKFKSRIVHYNNSYYCLEYAYYRIFPIYHRLKYWFDLGCIDHIGSWSVELFKERDFDSMAAQFNTIEKVRAYQTKQQKRHDTHIKNVTEHKQKRAKGRQIK